MLTYSEHHEKSDLHSKISSLPVGQNASFFNSPHLSNLSSSDSHFHATLRRIDQLANEDVEMQGPLSEFTGFLVVDTNIILHHFEVLKQFVEDIERLSLPVIVIVPGIVVYELDSQKSREGLAWMARRASAWLLDKVKERKTIKVQANEETCKSTGNWKKREEGETISPDMANDILILDCCMFFSRSHPAFLCSGDNNLCIASESQGIQAITPKRNWSSRQISHEIFGNRVDLNEFGNYQTSYKNPQQISNKVPVVSEDSMNVDDEDMMTPEVILPFHALDLLHLQVIDHFTRLLFDLVGTVGGDEVRQTTAPEVDANMSRHAPRRRHYMEWSVSDCLEYLNGRRATGYGHPRLDVFLSRPYSKPGARRGQDWSRRDWEVALENLKKIGVSWEYGSMSESLTVLEPHVNSIFMMELRPTGM